MTFMHFLSLEKRWLTWWQSGDLDSIEKMNIEWFLLSCSMKTKWQQPLCTAGSRLTKILHTNCSRTEELLAMSHKSLCVCVQNQVSSFWRRKEQAIKTFICGRRHQAIRWWEMGALGGHQHILALLLLSLLDIQCCLIREGGGGLGGPTVWLAELLLYCNWVMLIRFYHFHSCLLVFLYG